MESKKRTKIKSVSGFLRWVNKQKPGSLYRGLADASWGVSASLSRRLKQKKQHVSEVRLASATKTLLDEARGEGHDRIRGEKASNLALLAELQHFGAATCLIDFTKNPLVALWFACQPASENGKKTGKVVAIHAGDIDQFFEVSDEENSTGSFESRNLLFDQLGITYKEDQVNSWARWSPKKQNNRIIAQQSAFIFGDHTIKPNDDCAVINKEKIRKELEKLGISEASLFCDFTGFAQLNACNKPYAKTAQEFFKLGNSAFHAENHEKAVKDYRQAIENYTRAIEIDPNHAMAYYNRGNARAQSKDYPQAIDDYTRAIKINPRDASAYNNRGNARAQSKDYPQAIEDYSRAIEIAPDHAPAYYNRGIARAELEDYQGAIEDYTRAIEINLDYAPAYNSRGLSQEQLENYQDAIEDYSRAIKIAPDHAPAYNNRGITRAQLENYQDAIEDFTRAIKIAPDHADACYNRGLARAQLENYQDAIDDYSRAIVIAPDHAKAYYNRGNAHERSGDHEAAEKDFAAAKRLDPSINTPKTPKD